MNEQELFSNGFLFGMRYGLMKAGMAHVDAAPIIAKFIGVVNG